MRINSLENDHGRNWSGNRLVTKCQSHIHCAIYIMTNGDVRPSHSANFFKVTGRLEEEINQRPKRLREENNPLPEILIETPQMLL